ncbi:hypothetical protein ABK040_011779 [Willaertia magna]
MGSKTSRITDKNNVIDILDTPICSKRHRVFHYHLTKYEFPPKSQFSSSSYLNSLTKDYEALENEYNQAILQSGIKKNCRN